MMGNSRPVKVGLGFGEWLGMAGDARSVLASFTTSVLGLQGSMRMREAQTVRKCYVSIEGLERRRVKRNSARIHIYDTVEYKIQETGDHGESCASKPTVETVRNTTVIQLKHRASSRCCCYDLSPFGCFGQAPDKKPLKSFQEVTFRGPVTRA
jgi:hypothetical protein